MIGGAMAFIIIVLAFLGVLPGRKQSRPPDVELVFWDTENSQEIWREILVEFNKKYPHIGIKYKKVSSDGYEEMLTNNFLRGTGPDVFFIKNTWLRKHSDKLSPLPQGILPFQTVDFLRLFVDVAGKNLVTEKGAILGAPIYIDTLALFYNKDVFNAAGIPTAPKVWEDLAEISRSLTKLTPVGDVVRSGMALGTAKNVDHAFEILSALMLQYGDNIFNENLSQVALTKSGTDALSFYASFAEPRNSHFSWSNRMSPSLEALAEGKAVMAMGFANDIAKIRARNPHLNLGVAEFPQRKEAKTSITYAAYSFLGVSAFTPYTKEAWQFLLFLTTEEITKKYIERTRLPPARRDLVSIISPGESEDVFRRQTLTAQNWPVPDETPARNIFEEAIESVVSRAAEPQQAMQRLGQRLQTLFR